MHIGLCSVGHAKIVACTKKKKKCENLYIYDIIGFSSNDFTKHNSTED